MCILRGVDAAFPSILGGRREIFWDGILSFLARDSDRSLVQRQVGEIQDRACVVLFVAMVTAACQLMKKR
jgi:hypothetical protein